MMPTEEIVLDWVPPPPGFFPEIPGGSIVALDLETHDPVLKELGPGWAFKEGYIVGVALAWGRQRLLGCNYWPFKHVDGNWQGDQGKFMRWLRFQFRRTDLEWVFANSSYDLGWMGMIPEGAIHDVQVAAPLLDEHRYSYSLDNLAKTELGEGKDEDLLKRWAKAAGIKGNPKGMMAALPSAVVGPYAEQDARATWMVFQLQRQRIIDEDLSEVYQLEMDLVPMLIDMRRTGVRVDVNKAERLQKIVLAEEEDAAKHLFHSTGLMIGPWEIAAQIQALKAEGVKGFPKTAKKKVEGLTAGFLDALATHQSKAGEIASQIVTLRRKNRQRVTFIERLILEHHRNGRIHAQFNALRSDDGGTVSGRFSSQDPNLQQLPARDEEASSRIRGCFLAEEGEDLGSIDYASQEPRLAIHWAMEMGSKTAARMAEQFIREPRTDLHQVVADIMGIPRKQAKILNLAQMYGQGGGSLCLALGLEASPDKFTNEFGKEIEYLSPGRAGQRILEEYNNAMPFMKLTAKRTEALAREQGYITTLSGRRCHVRKYYEVDEETGDKIFTGDDARKAFNRRIQGSGADMIKRAMLNAWREGHKIRMTVHDENLFSLSGPEEMRRCAEIMNNSTKINLPIVCDMAIGKTWGTCVEMA
jgi:DNA polymerase I-like protein with 3'-5' exonuclease and polymerase domains